MAKCSAFSWVLFFGKPIEHEFSLPLYLQDLNDGLWQNQRQTGDLLPKKSSLKVLLNFIKTHDFDDDVGRDAAQDMENYFSVM